MDGEGFKVLKALADQMGTADVAVITKEEFDEILKLTGDLLQKWEDAIDLAKRYETLVESYKRNSR